MSHEENLLNGNNNSHETPSHESNETTNSAASESGTENQEQILDTLETQINEAEKIAEQIEQRSEDVIEKSNNSEALEKHKGIIDILKTKGLELLKNISQKLAETGMAQSFRDKHIASKAQTLAFKFDSSSKLLGAYLALKNTGEENFERGPAHVVALKEFLNNHDKAKPVLQTIRSSEWGKSKHAKSARQAAEFLLTNIVDRAVDVGLEQEMFEAIETYEKSGLLQNKKSTNFEQVVRRASNHVIANLGEHPTITQLEKACQGNPILICDRIVSHASKNGKTLNPLLVEKQLNQIIDRFPDGAALPSSTVTYFEKALDLAPEKYGVDPKSRQAIFGTLVANGAHDNPLSKVRSRQYFFKNELENMSVDEVRKVLEETGVYDTKQADNLLMYASLPLTEENFAHLDKKIFTTNFDGQNPEYSNEEFLKKLEAVPHGKMLPIPFFQHKKFGIDPIKRLELLNSMIKGGYSNDGISGFKLLASVFDHYQEVAEGLPPEEFEQSIQKLIIDSIRGDIEEVRTLLALLPGYDIPAKYKEDIKKAFISSYANNSSLSKIVVTEPSNENTHFSAQELWLKSNEMRGDLERKYYEKADATELRHFFFDVVEGTHTVFDKDLLFRTYASKMGELNPEEYIDLFLTGKKIPMEYADMFLKKVDDGRGLLEQLNEQVRLGKLNQEEVNALIVHGVEVGSYRFANMAFDESLEKKLVSPDLTDDLVKKFSQNYTSQMSAEPNESYEVLQYMFETRLAASSDGMTKEIQQKLFNSFFNEFAQHESLHETALRLIQAKDAYFDSAFPPGSEDGRKEFTKKLCETNDGMTLATILDGCLDETTTEHKLSFFKNIDGEMRTNLFNHGMEVDSLVFDAVAMKYIDRLPAAGQSQVFLDRLLSKDDLFKRFKNPQNIEQFYYAALRSVQKSREGEDGQKIISDDDAQKLFLKILGSENITLEVLDSLSGQKEFLLEDRRVLEEYVNTVIKHKNGSTSERILKRFKTEEKDEPILNLDQVQALSSEVLKHGALTDDLYQMYLDSEGGTPSFYLDQESFDAVLARMSVFNGPVGLNKSTSEILDLLNMQRAMHGKPGVIVMNEEQEKALIKKRLHAQQAYSGAMEQLWEFDPELFKKSFIEMLDADTLGSRTLQDLFNADQKVTEGLSIPIVKYCFKDEKEDKIPLFVNIVDRFSRDPIVLKEIKDSIDSTASIEYRALLKGKLLEKDLLEPGELKTFYEEMRAQKDVRSSVLVCAELLGSLASVEEPEQMKSFFNSGNEEIQQKITYISSFVKEHELQNKGRTIAVMLFAKEYLPERSPEEVIEKVAEALVKYEKVLNQNKYENIPDGLNASIGLEYEITKSTALGYKSLTGRELKTDIVRLSKAARIGSGADAVHEVATKPATNPYLMLLELQLLNDIEYIDLNFERSDEYKGGSHGYHLTIGGETGLNVNANTNFLQNSILAASWGGIQTGETGTRVSGGRGVTLRGRPPNDSHNVKMFDKATSSVELRSLAVDKMEPLQRSVVTAYHGAIAIQALEKYTQITSDLLYTVNANTPADLMKNLSENGYMKRTDLNEKEAEILHAWADLVSDMKEATEYHNTNFLEGETLGYLDKDKTWVDTEAFGGMYNKKRFDSVVNSIDPTLSVEEYVASAKIPFNDFFSSYSGEMADALTKTNNLYLKPATNIPEPKDQKKRGGSGDQANAIAMLEVTKLDQATLERRDEPVYLKGTIFDTYGERREGYYNAQGASEMMITHATQRALLKFNKKMEELLK
ncbi:MAG: hypothetical protein KA052_00560 [Candidatus Pacebacteria bacterium]|nr:hypothetical protein [Candidatus Paceibacterota bacterium]